MNNINLQIVTGNLTDSPTSREAGNSNVCEFTVASSREWKGKDGEEKKATEYMKVTAWGHLANACVKYLSKGAAVCVMGRRQTESWDGKDGKKNYMVKVIASGVFPNVMDMKRYSYPEPVPNPGTDQPKTDFNDAEIPF